VAVFSRIGFAQAKPRSDFPSNGRLFECPYQRRLSLEDAKLKVQLTGMTCPDGHPLTARQGKGIFLGCENYPDCDYTDKLSILAGM
jgi:ssDNA-binding Zn-finger/Zn-ribbon topoisomerase 1